MRMSKENFEKFRNFYNITIRYATDADMEILFAALKVLQKSTKEIAEEVKKANKKAG